MNIRNIIGIWRYVFTRKDILLVLGLIVLGIISNSVVVHVNGGMPAFNISLYHSVRGTNLVELTSQAKYSFLADVIWWGNGYCSIGDVLMGIGCLSFFSILVCIAISLVQERKVEQAWKTMDEYYKK